MQAHYRKGMAYMKLRRSYGDVATSFEHAKQIEPRALKLRAALDDAKKKQERRGGQQQRCVTATFQIRAWVAYTGDQFDPADIC